jgi:hypothetical protein
MDGGEFIGLVAVVLIFGMPFVGIITAHHRKLMEMKLKLGAQSQGAYSKELQDLKRAVDELRDTTTRYDISFDAALQRIESRVGHLEGRTAAIEQENAKQITR